MNVDPPPLAAKPKTPPVATTHSVWMIEDNSAFRRAIARALQDSPDIGDVRHFCCCEDALAELRTAVPPAIVLMDIALPGMDGLQGLERVKALSPDTAVVVLTVFEDEEKIFRAICSGASGYLLKTATAAEVVVAISDVRTGGSPITSHIARRVLEMFKRLSPKPAGYSLAAREIETLELAARGLAQKEIAAHMGVSIHTINTYLRRIYNKMQVTTCTAAVAKALRERLVQLPE